MAAHSSILAQRIPWTEEPGGQSAQPKQLNTLAQEVCWPKTMILLVLD